jgi:peptidyl-prolyl cis-trans isomerase A (cyclophilin A)
MKKMAFWLALVPVLVLAAGASAGRAAQDPRVLIRTELGDILVEIDSVRAPLTAANFLRYVDAKLYDGSTFHRTVTPASPRNKPVPIEVIQGGGLPPGVKGFGPIPLERTNLTGLKHEDGTISMARSGPDTATSSFFFCVGPQPELDFGGKRNADGQGFAAFGRVLSGMDVVRKIHASPASETEALTPPVRILSVVRVER